MRHLMHRGQTLVLFALTLLLLTLMVCVTLSIGAKAKEKMELETAADAAAYSQAVATARAFNSISLMNRALMSHMVAMTGVESLISWSSYYRASLNAAKKAYDTPKGLYAKIAAATCPCAPKSSKCRRLCRCSRKAIQDIGDTQDDLEQADDEAEKTFKIWDARAGEEAQRLQLSSIHARQLEAFGDLQVALNLGAQSARQAPLAPLIARDLGPEVSVLDASNDVNGRELGKECKGPGAACKRRVAGSLNHFISAAMGSRGHDFVTGRQGGAKLIRKKVIESMPANELVRLTNEGSAYFASSKVHAATADGGAVYGDDNGQVTVVFLRAQAPCPTFPPRTEEAFAHVRSDDSKHDTDEHEWRGGEDPNDRRRKHTMGDCLKCPGMWPSHMDYNYSLVARAADVFGQPKNYAVLQRDYSQRPPDPWNLFFRFRFDPAGQGTTFDNRGLRLTDGTNISRAVALSSGIAYYHRVGDAERWKEPPNFLNPFWRATLVGADVDQQRSVPDVLSTLGETGTPAREVAEALAKQGYQAW